MDRFTSLKGTLLVAQIWSLLKSFSRAVQKLVSASPFVFALLSGPVATAQIVAQPTVPPPPERTLVDQNNVNVASGAFSYTATELSIGQKSHGLTLSRYYGLDSGLRDNFSGMLNFRKFGTNLTERSVSAHFGGQSWLFEGGATYSRNGDGATVASTGSSGGIPAGYKLTMRDGTVITYSMLTPWVYTCPGGSESCSAYYYPTSLVHPNGLIVTLHYRVFTEAHHWLAARLQSVTNNAGYQIKFNYQSNTSTGSFLVRTGAVAINNSVEYCDPEADTCSLSGNWPSVSYTETIDTVNSSGVYTVTDALNRVTRYSYSRPSISIKTPGSATDNIQYAVSSAYNSTFQKLIHRVDSATLGSRTWTYTYTQPSPTSSYRTIKSTNPDNKQATFESFYDEDMGWLLTSTKDPLNRTAAFSYPCQGFDSGYRYSNSGVANVTLPEGNAVTYVCDVRGNVGATTLTPKAGSGLANISTTAAFPTSCTNSKTCNQPSATKDGRNVQTDYTYDAVHGGVLTETLPTDTNGIRPQKRYEYEQYYEYVRNAAGTLVPAASPIWMLKKISECRTAASCTNGGDEVVTSFEYGAISAINRLLLRGKVVTSSGVSLRTCYSYDAVGNQISVTTPRANLAVCPGGPQTAAMPFTTSFRFDAARQMVGVISPATGAGYEATRNTYDAEGRILTIEHGSLSQWRAENVVPLSWPQFAVMEITSRTYDGMGRLLTERRPYSTGGEATLTQYGYDAVGRLECTAVRMNPATYGSLPAACQQVSTQGAFGPDRIARQVYDAAGQLIKEQRAVGTSLAQDYAAYVYTPNGRIDWAEDAKGNRTRFIYDGFDRVSQLRFPQTAVGAHAENASDYEQYGYDGNNNRISLRLRSGESILYQFDLLNRVLKKTIPSNGTQVHYGYTLQGQNLFARFGSPTGFGVRNTFDGFGRLTTSTSIAAGGELQLTSQYDRDGNRERMTWPDGTYVEYTYDGLNRMDQVRENGASSGPGLVADYSYDAISRRSNLVRGNGAATAYYYDGISRLSMLSQDLASTSRDLNLGFTYNPASQVTQRQVSNDAYSYFSLTQARSYVPDGLNRYASVAGSTYGYDARGNLTSDGSRTFSYDLDNHLLSVSGSGVTAVNLTYDPMGRLWTTASGGTTTRYLYDGDRLVAEYNGSTLTRRYVHGAGVDEPLVWYEGSALTDRRWLHGDHQGSVVASSNGAGVGTVYAYSAYGEPAYDNWSGSRFRYTGQIMLPEAKLYHYKARVYDPILGRFLQTDPVGYKDDLNLYAYVGNDSLNKVDPTGMEIGAAFSSINCLTAGACSTATANASLAKIADTAGDVSSVAQASAAIAHIAGLADTTGTLTGNILGKVSDGMTLVKAAAEVGDGRTGDAAKTIGAAIVDKTMGKTVGLAAGAIVGAAAPAVIVGVAVGSVAELGSAKLKVGETVVNEIQERRNNAPRESLVPTVNGFLCMFRPCSPDLAR